MIFHSPLFAVFLVVTLGLFWALSARRRAREVLLLVASYAFYASWHPYYLGLIVFSTLLDHVCGRRIAASDDPGTRRRWLLLSLTGNIGVLAFFKCYDFFIESSRVVLQAVGFDVPLETLGLVIPVGISFYTFQTLSYTLDIYRRQLAPARSLLDFALFVAFFPQLVAGPIVRAVEFLPQLELAPRFDRQRLHDGLWRMSLGLAKKVLLADQLGYLLVDPVWAQPELYGTWPRVVALYAFTFQIYCDFSGYSDIAIGVARLFGFDLPENFHAPLRARCVREFWRRWHTTLSYWVRDYIYFPLGGSRGTPLRVSFNLMVTMLLLGLWHGASVLWLLYGLVHGVAVAGERLATRGRGPDLDSRGTKALAGWLVTFHFTVGMLVLVRAITVEALGEFTGPVGPTGSVPVIGMWILAAAAVTHFAPDRWGAACARTWQRLPTLAVSALVGALAGLLALVMVGETPYIYFQF